MTEREHEPVWLHVLDGLRNFVARRVPAGEVDDVLQDILLRLHRAAASLRDDRRVEAWIYGIARHAIADFYRKREPVSGKATGVVEEADPDAQPPENLAAYDGDHVVHEEVLSWLRPMAEELPEAYGRALIMADFEGRTLQEVADALGLSLSGAKSRVRRARALLGKALRSCCAIEFGPDARVTAFRRLRRDPR
ncbi:sigma-70 family RNA polymerase sigma factor [Rhodocaloribacter litoris]|uniref:sigma-70 family RNA polymerase sigma factor n=1 Tax=Rhodocaloribacter litoris TaxID=2558931 RepID=UPI00141DFC3A|nr:sigma-70 family RNA polymerase sigma factor [Rhodocaloribacter litoris]QXD14866.1 sigma-70 family RNA polymerase sigma factor [Rhodocaloribacter litoris]